MNYFPHFHQGFTPWSMPISSPVISSSSMFATSVSISETIRDFFRGLFYNPGQNKIAIIVIIVVTVAAVVGIAFLIKILYERYQASLE